MFEFLDLLECYDGRKEGLPSVGLTHKLIQRTRPCYVWIWKVDLNRFRTAAMRWSLTET